METSLRKVVVRMINCIKQMVTLSGTYKNLGDFELKIKKLDCLLSEAELIIAEMEAFEKQIIEEYEKEFVEEII